jgi:hypothetical protein
MSAYGLNALRGRWAYAVLVTPIIVPVILVGIAAMTRRGPGRAGAARAASVVRGNTPAPRAVDSQASHLELPPWLSGNEAG